MSGILDILAQLRSAATAVGSAIWAIDVRNDIASALRKSADAIEECYRNVNSASLREDAFAAALQDAIDDELLPIPATVIDDNSLPGSKIQQGSLPLDRLAEPVQITVDSALSDSSTNPVQNKVIKDALDEVNGSLDDVKEHIGLPITRKLLTSDIQQASSDGVYDVDGNGNIIATTAPTNSKTEILIFKDAIAVEYDDNCNGSQNLVKASRIVFAAGNNTNWYYLLKLNAGASGITGVISFASATVNGSTSNITTYNDDFGSGTYLKHVKVEKTGDGIDVTITDRNDVEYSYTIPYATMGATYETSFIGIGNMTQGLNSISDGKTIISNVKITTPSAEGGVDSDSPLHGKTWEVYGDSYSAPSGITKYMDVISTNTGCTVSNYAVSGRKMSEIASEIPSGTTTNSLMTLFAGYNDYANSTSLAQFETDTKSVIDALVARNMNADIGIICTSQCGQAYDSTNYKSNPPYDCRKPNNQNLTLEDYADKLKEIAEGYGLPCLDLYHRGQVRIDVSDYLDLYFGDNGLHPKANQHLRFSKLILHWLENDVITT